MLYGGSLRPEVIRIVYVAAQTSRGQTGPHIVVSEGYRKIRDTRDLHQELRAFDISLNTLPGDFEERERRGTEWAERMKAELGPDYTVIVHGGGHNLHIHVELDP